MDDHRVEASDLPQTDLDIITIVVDGNEPPRVDLGNMSVFAAKAIIEAVQDSLYMIESTPEIISHGEVIFNESMAIGVLMEDEEEDEDY